MPQATLRNDRRGWWLVILAAALLNVAVLYVIPGDKRPSFFTQLVFALLIGAGASVLGLIREKRR